MEKDNKHKKDQKEEKKYEKPALSKYPKRKKILRVGGIRA